MIAQSGQPINLGAELQIEAAECVLRFIAHTNDPDSNGAVMMALRAMTV